MTPLPKPAGLGRPGITELDFGANSELLRIIRNLVQSLPNEMASAVIGHLVVKGGIELSDEAKAYLQSFVEAVPGPPGPAGPPGGTGNDGSVWRSGVGVPDPTLGKDTDFYLDTSNGDVYNKSGGAWTFQGNIRGATGSTGAPGAQWYSGAGAPSAGTGINGDLYLNTTNDDVYQKAAGSWSVVGNIRGATGPGGTPADYRFVLGLVGDYGVTSVTVVK